MGHMSMKQSLRAAVTLLALLTGAAHAQDGLVNNPEGRWAARLTSQLDEQGQRRSVAWLGDYRFAARGVHGGLRATAGVVWGQSSPRMASPDDLGLVVDSAASRPDARFGASTASLEGRTAAYAGIGYTHLQAGWRLHADMGLAWRLSRGNVKLGATDSGTTLEDVLRNARLAPLMQLSASYAF